MSDENFNDNNSSSEAVSDQSEPFLDDVKDQDDNLKDYQEMYNELFKEYQYLTAEVSNMKKRFEGERERIFTQSENSFLGKLLNTLDIFTLVLEHLEDDKAKETLTTALNQLLDEFNISVHTHIGDQFDPLCHEAISTSEGNEGLVTKIFKKGYTHKNSVIRIALVEVGS